MGIIIAIIVIGFVGFIALGLYGNAKQSDYESKALSEIADKGIKLNPQTKTGYGIIGVDESKRELVIVNSELINQKWISIPFDEIFSCELIVDGQSVFKKSAVRTVGGAALGGVIAGGVGAVIGGLSGSYKENKDIKRIDLRVVTKSISNNMHYITFFSDGTNKAYLKSKMAEAESWKNTISVIIDKVDNEENKSISVPSSSSIADELSKLAELKEKGVLTEEEFVNQKSKLLNN